MKISSSFAAVVLGFAGMLLCGTANAQRTATATATVVNGFVVAITVTDGGASYISPPAVTISGGGGNGATAVATIANGAVTQVVVGEAGNGYSASPAVTVDSPTPNRAATATASVVNGFVVSITVKDGGAGYTVAPAVSLSGGGGSGATAMATLLSGAVDKIIVQNAGSGYRDTPTVVIGASAVAKAPFSDGLVGYYPFNGNALDESGMGNDGVAHGATLGTDRFGAVSNAYVFRATGGFPSWTGDYISTAAANGFPTGTQDFTVALWVNVASNSPDYQMLFCNQSVNQFQLGIVPLSGATQLGASYGELWFNTGNEYGPQCRAAADWILNHWYQVAVVRSSNTLNIYRDGRLAGQGEASFGNSAAPADRVLTFGYRTHPANHPLWGALDDIRIYDRALSAEEVTDLYYYEAPEEPWLAIHVQSIRVTMHVKPTKKYQLQASLDLRTWTNAGAVFVAATAEIVQDFDAAEVGRYFRLFEVR